MNRRQRIGRWGENIAKDYIKKHGYEFIESNVRTPYGELDLIMKHGDVIIFVEVKTRTSRSFGFPEESITAKKQAHLIEAAQAYLQLHPEFNNGWRVDVIAIQGIPGEHSPRIEWFENAIS